MKIIVNLFNYVHEKPVLVKSLTFRKFVERVSWLSKTFIIDSTKPTVQTDRSFIYFMDFSNGTQIQFEKTENSLPTPAFLDVVVNQNVLEKITKNLSTDKMQLIVYGIIGALLGGMLTALIAILYYTNQITELLAGMPTETPTVVF